MNLTEPNVPADFELMGSEAIEMGSSSSSLSTEVGPTEDVLKALLEYLVDPMRPLKSSTREAPSISQQQLVARQVHAAVLLYNFYHRKCHPELEFLGFVSFCKLAVTLKPSLMVHMKFMHQFDHSKLDDLENELSLTEKAIMDACSLSRTLLVASQDVSSSLKGWPITKVAVLLVDSMKENCLLLFSSVTNGVWSVIEKDLDSDDTAVGSKRKRKPSLMSEQDADNEAGFQQLAFSAVKETTGLNRAELNVLESSIVYSLNKEKTAARFYIVQCTQSISQDLQVPIKDAIHSLQGPVVKESSGGWVTTPVVEYFHVLPYAGIVSDWFSREVLSNSLQDRVEVENTDVNISPILEKLFEKELDESKGVFCNTLHKNLKLGSEDVLINNSRIENPLCKEEIENRDRLDKKCTTSKTIGKGTQIFNFSEVIEDPCDKDIIETRNSNGEEASVANSEFTEPKGSNGSCTLFNSSNGPPNMDIKAEVADLKTMSIISECRDEKVDTKKKSCIISRHPDGTPTVDRALVPFQQNTNNLEKMQSIMAAKGSELSQTALRVLIRKRKNLSNQLRSVEDEMTLCDRNIQAIFDGAENDFALKLEAIIACCNEVCAEDEKQALDRMNRHVDDQGLPQFVTGKKLSEAILNMRTPCQELDDICRSNSWRLPMHHVSPSDGGFMANVTVKGVDFECSGGSDLHHSPGEARDSAALLMIAKLRRMASQAL